MPAPTIPYHCGQEMAIVHSALKCPGCGFEIPNPGAGGIGDKPPMHCGLHMALARDLKCLACGFATADTVSLEPAPAATPAPAPQPLPRLRQVDREHVTVTDLVGRTWARYRVVSQVGRGGMAIVYKAYQPGLDRHVAIKFMLPPGVPDPTLVKRFKQEAELIAKLRHPNIVTVLDFGEKQGVPYLVMEYVPGETLAAKLGRPMALEPALQIVGQVARALDYAHSQGIVHRDVKPSNILLAREDWALLSDFGIAKPLASPMQLTQTGASIGTPEYMAPEQGQGLKVDARCDVYALGVMLYEMLTGRPPFTGDTPLSVMLRHCNEPLPPPRDLNPNIPDALEQVIFKATAKDPAQRFASAGEMAVAFASLGATGPAFPLPPSPDAPTVIEVEPTPLKPERAAVGRPAPVKAASAAARAAAGRPRVPWAALLIGTLVLILLALAIWAYAGR